MNPYTSDVRVSVSKLKHCWEIELVARVMGRDYREVSCFAHDQAPGSFLGYYKPQRRLSFEEALGEALKSFGNYIVSWDCLRSKIAAAFNVCWRD